MNEKVTVNETANLYISKAITLLEKACQLREYCDNCPFRAKGNPRPKCAMETMIETVKQNLH